MALSALRSVSDAIDATRAFLLPLAVRRWGALAVLALFLGTPGTPAPANPQFLDPTIWRGPQAAVEEQPVQGQSPELSFELLEPATWPAWLVGLAVAVVVLFLAYQVLGVLVRFVLVEALSRGEVRLRCDGRANAGNAARVVGFRLGLALVTAPLLLGLVAAVAPIGPWSVDGWVVGALGAAATGVTLAAWAVDAATLQFVVPTMLGAEVGVLAGWRRFGSVLADAWREYVAYVVVRVAVGIGVGIASLIGVAIALALGGLVAVTLGAVVVALAGGLSGIGTAATAALLAIGLGFLCYAIVAAAAVAVPFQVYLWTYALLVLGDTDAELDLIPELRAEARDGGPL